MGFSFQAAVALFGSTLLLLSPLDVLAAPNPRVLRGVAAPVVDLGYSTYQGYYDGNYSVNVFKGIRYAAPPVGELRWQVPREPIQSRSVTILATEDPPQCPQSGAAKLPAAYGFLSGPGNEDCLFLNVFAPPNATNLPVFLWIHGGGYGLFSASGLNAGPIINMNDGSFIAVVIQYRLGAFGFLPGADVKKYGTLNAGLLDMNFALQWVQKHITKFGGDPDRVTVAGESAGAGAVMYQSLAYGGKQNQSLFQNAIAASPWVPGQYDYNDTIPTAHYDAFVSAAGCSNASNKFKCLVAANSTILQNASAQVSTSGAYGTFAFLPVTDGTFIQTRPSQQLLSKALRGKRLLTGNNANEGIPLAPPTSGKTLRGFLDYVRTTFPLFTASDLSNLQTQYAYSGSSNPTDASNPLYDTSGTSPSATAKNQSSFATGQQQRLFDVFAESTFDCPSYWLADAFPTAWKYQYSAPPAYHGADLTALWSADSVTPGKGFIHAFQKIWGSFIVNDTPVISIADAKGGVGNASVPVGATGMVDWPVWTEEKREMLNLNETGGVKTLVNVTQDLQYYVYLEPGVTNKFKLVDAESWEGGRGERCQWWRGVSARVPV